MEKWMKEMERRLRMFSDQFAFMAITVGQQTRSRKEILINLKAQSQFIKATIEGFEATLKAERKRR